MYYLKVIYILFNSNLCLYLLYVYLAKYIAYTWQDTNNFYEIKIKMCHYAFLYTKKEWLDNVHNVIYKNKCWSFKLSQNNLKYSIIQDNRFVVLFIFNEPVTSVQK